MADATFGSCLKFDGSSGYIDMGDILNPGNSSWSVSLWFNADRITGDNILYNKENLYEAAAKGSKFDYAWNPHWNWNEQLNAIQTNTWYHATVVYDKSKQFVYLNGVLISERSQSGDIGTNTQKLLIGARGNTNPNSYFQGKMAHLKVFSRALSAEQVQEEYTAHTHAQSAYLNVSPLKLELFDEQEFNRMYINEDVPDTYFSNRERHELNIKIVNNHKEQFTIEKFPAEGSDHHFELVFRANVLHSTLKDSAKLTERFNFSDWLIRYRSNSDTEQPDSILFEYTGGSPLERNSGEALQIELKDMHAAAAHGARSTAVELKYKNLKYGTDSNFEGFTRANLEIVNHTGKKNIPLHIDILGNNSVLNDGNAANKLKLCIANTSSEKPIMLRPGTEESSSKFTLSFSAGSNEYDLSNSSRVGQIAVTTPNDWGSYKPTQSSTIILHPGGTNNQLAANASVFFDITNMVVDTPSGVTHMKIAYKNIPGYWDGEFSIPVEKTPIVHRMLSGNKNVERNKLKI